MPGGAQNYLTDQSLTPLDVNSLAQSLFHFITNPDKMDIGPSPMPTVIPQAPSVVVIQPRRVEASASVSTKGAGRLRRKAAPAVEAPPTPPADEPVTDASQVSITGAGGFPTSPNLMDANRLAQSVPVSRLRAIGARTPSPQDTGEPVQVIKGTDEYSSHIDPATGQRVTSATGTSTAAVNKLLTSRGYQPIPETTDERVSQALLHVLPNIIGAQSEDARMAEEAMKLKAALVLEGQRAKDRAELQSSKMPTISIIVARALEAKRQGQATPEDENVLSWYSKVNQDVMKGLANDVFYMAGTPEERQKIYADKLQTALDAYGQTSGTDMGGQGQSGPPPGSIPAKAGQKVPKGYKLGQDDSTGQYYFFPVK